VSEIEPALVLDRPKACRGTARQLRPQGGMDRLCSCRLGLYLSQPPVHVNELIVVTEVLTESPAWPITVRNFD
jgi:hypothetical protein